MKNIDVRIYRPAKTATQSGSRRSLHWQLEFLPCRSTVIDPLTGWSGTDDPRRQVRLAFPDRASAIAFATRRNWTFVVEEDESHPVRNKSYASNFT